MEEPSIRHLTMMFVIFPFITNAFPLILSFIFMRPHYHVHRSATLTRSCKWSHSRPPPLVPPGTKRPTRQRPMLVVHKRSLKAMARERTWALLNFLYLVRALSKILVRLLSITPKMSSIRRLRHCRTRGVFNKTRLDFTCQGQLLERKGMVLDLPLTVGFTLPLIYLMTDLESCR